MYGYHLLDARRLEGLQAQDPFGIEGEKSILKVIIQGLRAVAQLYTD